jgi:hypothetical protein
MIEMLNRAAVFCRREKIENRNLWPDPFTT